MDGASTCRPAVIVGSGSGSSRGDKGLLLFITFTLLVFRAEIGPNENLKLSYLCLVTSLEIQTNFWEGSCTVTFSFVLRPVLTGAAGYYPWFTKCLEVVSLEQKIRIGTDYQADDVLLGLEEKKSKHVESVQNYYQTLLLSLLLSS